MAMQGSCLCGTVRFEVTEPLTAMLNCHCSRCRKSHGAPFATFATTSIDGLRWLSGKDEVVSNAAPPGGPRHFCGRCGSPAPSTLESMGIAFFPVGLLDEDPQLRPQAHLFVGSKAAWHGISDALPQYEKYPPEFGNLPGLESPSPAQASEGHLAGSCLCGQVAYELKNPVAMFQCHCSRCRKARGAAHGANLFCKADDFRWTRGESLVVDYKLPSARFFGVAFCGHCGASVPRVSKERGIAVVPASSVDSDLALRPAAHIFVGSKAPWFEITDDIPQYAEGPPSFAPPPPQASSL